MSCGFESLPALQVHEWLASRLVTEIEGPSLFCWREKPEFPHRDRFLLLRKTDFGGMKRAFTGYGGHGGSAICTGKCGITRATAMTFAGQCRVLTGVAFLHLLLLVGM